MDLSFLLLQKTRLKNGIWAWGLGPSKYVAQAVKNFEKHPTNKLHSRYQLPPWADNPFLYIRVEVHLSIAAWGGSVKSYRSSVLCCLELGEG
jgi:hypothetical protein